MPLPELSPPPPECEPEVLPLLPLVLPEVDPLAPGLDDGERDEELAPLPWLPLPLSPLPPPLQAVNVAERKRAGTSTTYLFM